MPERLDLEAIEEYLSDSGECSHTNTARTLLAEVRRLREFEALTMKSLTAPAGHDQQS